MVLGILVIALPVTVLCNNFNDAWKEKEGQSKRTEIQMKIANDARSGGLLKARQKEFGMIVGELTKLTPELRSLLQQELHTSGLQISVDAGYGSAEKTLHHNMAVFKEYVNTTICEANGVVPKLRSPKHRAQPTQSGSCWTSCNVS